MEKKEEKKNRRKKGGGEVYCAARQTEKIVMESPATMELEETGENSEVCFDSVDQSVDQFNIIFL